MTVLYVPVLMLHIFPTSVRTTALVTRTEQTAFTDGLVRLCTPINCCQGNAMIRSSSQLCCVRLTPSRGSVGVRACSTSSLSQSMHAPHVAACAVTWHLLVLARVQLLVCNQCMTLLRLTISIAIFWRCAAYCSSLLCTQPNRLGLTCCVSMMTVASLCC